MMLAVEQLAFSFPGRPLLVSVSFRLRTHAVTCLLGGNGSGKTTLLNLITGFLRPDTGSIRLGETEISHRAPFRISRLGMARTFQDLRLVGKLSVRDNVLLAIPSHPGESLARALLPPHFHRDRDAADRRKADALLAEYFLTEVADQPASEISYGQQKLLTLACLCVSARRQASLKAAGKTILLIEHQPDFLERTGDAFLYLQAGRLHRFDTLAALRAAPVAHDSLDTLSSSTEERAGVRNRFGFESN